MKNLAVYCNHGPQEFISSFPPRTEKKMDELLTKQILTTKQPGTNSVNNYILVMNVLGTVDE
jgi:hypothetical protein